MSATRRVTAALALAIAVAAGALSATAIAARPAGCAVPTFGPGTGYRPRIVPRDFSADVTNPFFPLRPGRALVYTGTREGERALDLVLTTPRIRVVDGVRTRVVEDRLYLAGVLGERTSDYYAQDRCGNVWYFGEDTARLDRRGRVVDTEGSFRAGEGGAQPGVVMQAGPQVGRRFRQEWFEGHAEDTFSVVARSARVAVPRGAFRHALRTRETTALEPRVLGDKFYVRGIGVIAERSVRGPHEVLRLVEVIS